MVKSPTKKNIDMKVGLGSLMGLSVHVKMIWVVILFVLITALVCTYGGLYEHLPRRQFPATTVNGDLSVEGGIKNPTGVVAPTSSVVAVAAGAFSPLATVANTTYLVTGTLTASAITLPSGAKTGDTVIIKMVSATLAALMVTNAADVSVTCPSGEAFETNSYVLAQDFAAASNGSAQLSMTTDAVLSAAGNNRLTLTGETAGGPGNGSEIIMTKLNNTRWLLRGTLYGAGAGTGAVGDTAAFSTV